MERMSGIWDKEIYMDIQSRVYEIMKENIKNEKVPSLEFKIRELGILKVPEKEVLENRKYTANINEWLIEIEYFIGIIAEELLYLLSYEKIYCSDKKLSPYVITSRERYFKLVIYDLYSIREKLAYLIIELFNREIDLNYEKLSFNRLLKKINESNLGNIEWISEDEYTLIKKVLIENFKSDSYEYIFEEIRHSFTHRSNPGIGFIPLRTYEYKKVDEKILQILENRMGEEKDDYISISLKPKEKQFNSKILIEDLLDMWRLFIKGFELLFKRITLLNNEIIKFY